MIFIKIQCRCLFQLLVHVQDIYQTGTQGDGKSPIEHVRKCKELKFWRVCIHRDDLCENDHHAVAAQSPDRSCHRR
eukprot:scaffold40676_cov48-Prasinocladus_malaysianus.AAC.1